jgi:hypothetical protein
MDQAVVCRFLLIADGERYPFGAVWLPKAGERIMAEKYKYSSILLRNVKCFTKCSGSSWHTYLV